MIADDVAYYFHVIGLFHENRYRGLKSCPEQKVAEASSRAQNSTQRSQSTYVWQNTTYIVIKKIIPRRRFQFREQPRDVFGIVDEHGL
jgi:hypothetical protein